MLRSRIPHYEVEVATAGTEPNAIEVEVSDRRLMVRFPGPDRRG